MTSILCGRITILYTRYWTGTKSLTLLIAGNGDGCWLMTSQAYIIMWSGTQFAIHVANGTDLHEKK